MYILCDFILAAFVMKYFTAAFFFFFFANYQKIFEIEKNGRMLDFAAHLRTPASQFQLSFFLQCAS